MSAAVVLLPYQNKFLWKDSLYMLLTLEWVFVEYHWTEEIHMSFGHKTICDIRTVPF
jgi:hypothetical protein